MLTPEMRLLAKELAAEIAAGIKRELGIVVNHDMSYIASLPPKERKQALKELRK